MRKELYNAIAQRLQTVSGGAIKHIDLWNHNVEFIEQEDAWQRPAVFVEFEPIKWEATVPAMRYCAETRVLLHIVTDWQGSSAIGSPTAPEALSVFDLELDIHRALTGLSGNTFRALDLVESHTNHNHEQLVESIEVYSTVAYRTL